MSAGRVQAGESPPPLAALAARAFDQTRGLLRREMDLARAEIDERVGHAGAALALLAGSLVLALAALNVLAGALVAALAELGLDRTRGAVIVGLALASTAAAMALRAMTDLKRARIAPRAAADRLGADARAAATGEARETSDDR